MFLFIICFLGGVFTVFSPCVIPILPFILGAGVEAKRKQLIYLILGLVSTFGLFTLFGAILIKSLSISLNSLRYVSAGILAIFGLFLIFPKLDQIAEAKIASLFGGKSFGDGKYGFLAGMALGLVWAPCAGPVMGAISSLIATQPITFKIVFFVISFCMGVASALLVFGILSEKLTNKLRSSISTIANLRRLFGVICLGLAVLFALNKEAIFISKFSDYIQIEKFIPDFNSVQDKLIKDSNLKDKIETEISVKNIASASSLPIIGKAAEFKDIKIWLNSNGETLESLRGKVVLVDFWTYSCVNCLRTLPYVKAWSRKYSGKNFQVVGIHTPEFAFEYEKSNVENAIKELGINYPVGLDNDYGTWKAYENQYWPAHYLIDAQGNIRYTHFGEGNYQETENAIQELISENGIKFDLNKEIEAGTAFFEGQTPETYLGFHRIKNIVNEFKENSCSDFSAQKVNKDQFSLNGSWCIREEYSISQKNAELTFNVRSAKVFLVASSEIPKNIKISDELGNSKEININESKLYELIGWDGFGDHTIKIEVPSDMKLYAFTFGGI